IVKKCIVRLPLTTHHSPLIFPPLYFKNALCLKQNISIILSVGYIPIGEETHTQDGYLNWGQNAL
ncbi:MAG: hypothetical protein U9Q91_08005, partial [Candidatus Marinimicrobia bacterium]|nr:hypothetical protein [Candidatus Neomarinimicrobiota bacterium]